METRRIIGYGLFTAAATSIGLNFVAKKLNSKNKNQFKDAETHEASQRNHNGIPPIMTNKSLKKGFT